MTATTTQVASIGSPFSHRIRTSTIPSFVGESHTPNTYAGCRENDKLVAKFGGIGKFSRLFLPLIVTTHGTPNEFPNLLVRQIYMPLSPLVQLPEKDQYNMVQAQDASGNLRIMVGMGVASNKPNTQCHTTPHVVFRWQLKSCVVEPSVKQPSAFSTSYLFHEAYCPLHSQHLPLVHIYRVENNHIIPRMVSYAMLYEKMCCN